ncbi:xanthine dehydrogenase family protein molybdopterin-binding subunit [Ferrovibrio sp.]|uniref:xanthine dehydrogenase family protein molybdopterin-binding subunit n=1 Tax=Ferrovibrio sp. TaxID=1917215 RepID=UPI0025C09DF9|nr:xanthine dehydrogenase family protein molybdopterin-binding subunit [Ferrovibrio sp.]MBX3456457.1 xanthine dehydrogenase family protein molybdopterin-binding subunit [Ferrovibrio sp.]
MTQPAAQIRRDSAEKVTGEARFVTDIALPGMLHARLLRSTMPHARITGIDAAAALDMPGVVAVLTGADFAGLKHEWGLFLRDRPLIAIDRVRYVGEPVAVVVAEDEYSAEEALDAIVVDYDPLPHVTDAEAALAPDAPLVHETMETLKDFYFKGEAKPLPGTNIFQNYRYECGDVDAAFAAADHVFEDAYDFPMVFHYAMEPHCVVAEYSVREGFTLHSCAQSPSAVQKVLHAIFGTPLSKIRVIVPYVGGGFGGKASVKLDPLAAGIAWKLQRPVRLCLSVAESMLTCRRLNARVHLRSAVAKDGTLLAKAVRVVMNGGAYADTGPAVAIKAANRAIGPYRIPNLRLEAQAVYTNTVPGAAFRSIGGPQAVWATESQMDTIAEALELDPLELRRRNLLRRGETVRPDLRSIDVEMAEALGEVSKALPHRPGEARGFAVAASDPGIMPIGSAMVRLGIDGSITVMANSVEIGQGVRAVLAKLAAEALNQPIAAVDVAETDTLTAPFDWGTGASRSTVIMGCAVQEAAADAGRKLLAMAATTYEVPESECRLVEGGVLVRNQHHTFRDLFHRYFGIDSGDVSGIGSITPQYRNGAFLQAPLFWETAAAGCSISVDEDTGEILVKDYVSAADVGRVINRLAAEGQDEGAAMQGLGHSLFEELLYEDGQPVNASMIDYHVPLIDESPAHFETILIENGDGPGPGGARGMGEGAILPVAPAIANALAAGHGVRIKHLPLTPEKVWRSLRAAKAGL